MEYSLAPLEGVTSFLFRKIHNEMFGGVSRYYAPFIAPDGSGKYKASHQRDILPENNRGIELIPQILANDAAAFLAVARELAAMGYKEVNLNVGCPSGTVVTKHKGSGMLADLGTLDCFLDKIYSECPIDISVKTRMGLDSTSEFPQIIEIYNKYPVSRLTIHARDRAGQYKSTPDIEMLSKCLPYIKAEAEYNGNIFSADDVNKISSLPSISSCMIGRGAITQPSIFRELNGGDAITRTELKEFHDRMLSSFRADGLSDYFTICRMKELWRYWSCKFPECKKELKALNKSKSYADYVSSVDALFRNCEFDISYFYK